MPAKELVSLADTTDLYATATGLIERSAAAFASGVPEGTGDDGLFGPASVTWRMSADLASPVAGLRSLLMQALHPLAMAGVDQHGGWRRDPVGRLAATTAYLATVTFGDRAAARHAAARVRRIHDHVHGVDTVTGRPYAAGDPALLLWVHGALVDSVLAAGSLVGRALSAADSDRYVAEMVTVAELTGVPRHLVPSSVPSLTCTSRRSGRSCAARRRPPPCSSVSPACSRRGSGSPCGCAEGGAHEAHQAHRRGAGGRRGHPTIHIPGVVSELSTRRLLTSELSGGVRFAELATWPQHERDLAAETIYRFVFRSLYEVRAFNGDPHPGNYLFHPGGKVTFLDFGLVRRFSPAELQPLLAMARTICVEHDPEAFRHSLEQAGFLRPGAPLSTEAITGHLAVFYDTIREPGPLTITSDYASAVVRRFFDLRSPVANYISVPRSYMILQRINLGLFAVLGELSATADWRAISEEIWPFVQGPAATPMGEAEAAWQARHQAAAA